MLDRQTDRDGNTLFEAVSVGVNGFGVKNTQFFFGYRPEEKILIGDRLLSQSYFSYFVQFDPYRRIPRVTIQGRVGESIDFGSGRVGDGASISLGTTLRPLDRLDLRVDATRETLDVEGSRIFTVYIERLRAQYSFSAKSLVRVIAQNVGPELDQGSFLGSVLYSYKVNWQTVLFVGYGDQGVLTPGNDYTSGSRSLFFKVSYAYQR